MFGLFKNNKLSKNGAKGGIATIITAISVWAGGELSTRIGIPQEAATVCIAFALGAALNFAKGLIRK